ncbi:MAG: SurA N-terminal domain-containing protein [Lentisphaeria bacterium]|nr:SurA N-terminal domain-containing protein [Lentisphaeria bacterium]
MVIRKMNTVLVKHNKIFFGIFSVIIIISFVWFFTPGLDGSALFGGRAGSPNAVVATVFGKNITNKQYQQAYRDRVLLLEAITGREAGQFHEYLQQTLLMEIARESAAEMLGVTATDEEVTNFIRNTCMMFRGKAGFDPELYRKFAEAIQEREGRSIEEFESLVRRMLAAEKMSAELAAGVYLTPDEKDRMAVLLKEKFDARMIEFPFAAYKNIKQGSPAAKAKGLGEEDMLNYYKSNQKQFMTEPQMKALVVKFPYLVANYAPTEKEIQAYYKEHEHDFHGPDGKHLELAKVRGKVAEAIRQEKGRNAARKAAMEFRNALYTATESAETAAAQIAAFRKLAAERKLQLIDTGWFTAQTAELKGIGKEPALIAALLKTNPKHNPLLSASLRGEQAVYVAGSTGSIPSAPADFKDVKSKVWEALLADYAKRAAMEAAQNFMNQIAADPKAAENLAALAKKAGAKVSALKQFSRDMQDPSQTVMFARQLAYSLPDRTISRPEETPVGMMLVFLDRRTPPTEAEKKAAQAQLDSVLTYSKQMMQQNTVGFWVQSNIQSRITSEEK